MIERASARNTLEPPLVMPHNMSRMKKAALSWARIALAVAAHRLPSQAGGYAIAGSIRDLIPVTIAMIGFGNSLSGGIADQWITGSGLYETVNDWLSTPPLCSPYNTF